VDNLDTRYLGLTGILIVKEAYDKGIQPGLEALKRQLFRYDPDDPPILTRSVIKHRKRWFYVLQDEGLNKRGEDGLLTFVSELSPHAKVFTVVIDKKKHLEEHPVRTFDPYAYSLAVLLRRVKGFLVLDGAQADLVAESRGRVEDQDIMQAYSELRRSGDYYDTAEEYRKACPEDQLVVRRKETNVAGLQLADVIAFGQKVQTVLEHNRPFSRPLGDFDKRLNDVVDRMVNQYSRYFLE
jgi:hypothetical protein